MKREQDHFARRAKQEGFPARSIYKLKEIQEKHQFLRPGDRVIDLGCFPGSWLKYLGDLLGPKGFVLAYDLQDLQITPPPNAKFIQADVLQLTPQMLIPEGSRWNALVSDMAPSTTGNKVTDSERSFALCDQAVELAEGLVRQGGSCLVKSLQGVAHERLLKRMRSLYKSVKTVKPQGTRTESKEVFLLGQGKINPPHALPRTEQAGDMAPLEEQA